MRGKIVQDYAKREGTFWRDDFSILWPGWGEITKVLYHKGGSRENSTQKSIKIAGFEDFSDFSFFESENFDSLVG